MPPFEKEGVDNSKTSNEGFAIVVSQDSSVTLHEVVFNDEFPGLFNFEKNIGKIKRFKLKPNQKIVVNSLFEVVYWTNYSQRLFLPSHDM